MIRAEASPAQVIEMTRGMFRRGRGRFGPQAALVTGESTSIQARGTAVDSSLLIVGLNSRTSPSDVRERFWMDEIARSEVAARLAHSAGISEVVVLLGKARIEYIVWADDPSDAATSILQVLSQRFGLKLCEWEHFYRVTDTAAVAHVFALACEAASDNDADDVDSRAELAAAWQHARQAGTTGRLLDALFTKAFALADQARANALRTTLSNAIAGEAKSFHKKLLAERVQPATAVLRVRVEDICRQELEVFERSLPAMNSPQKDTMTELRVRVTKRIASEVEHELKGLKQTAAQQNTAETAQRLLTHGLLRNAINRSQN